MVRTKTKQAQNLINTLYDSVPQGWTYADPQRTG